MELDEAIELLGRYEQVVKHGSGYTFANNKSFNIYKSGDKIRIKDFGSTGFFGDVYDYLKEFYGVGFAEAKNLRIEVIPAKEKPTIAITPAEPVDIEGYLKKLTPATFKCPIFAKEAIEIAPMKLWQQADTSSITWLKQTLAIDPYLKTTVFKIHNKEGEVVSAKRRRMTIDGEVIKWVALKGTKPNVSIYRERCSDTLRIVEGHHDCIVAVLLGISFLMLPTSGYKLTEADIAFSKNFKRVNYIIHPDKAGDELYDRCNSLIKGKKINLGGDLADYCKTNKQYC